MAQEAIPAATDAPQRGSDADERELVAWVRDWGQEVDRADIRAGRERFLPELTAFGTHADVVRGRDQVEAEQWAQVWPAITSFSFRTEQMQIELSPDRLLAVLAVPWDSTGVAEDGTPFPRPGRATIVVRRSAIGEPWFGVHTHFSLARGVPSRTFGTRTAIR